MKKIGNAFSRILAGLLTSAASSEILTVCSSGCGYTSLADAISAASDGDEIQVLAGTYSGPFEIDGLSVSITGIGNASEVVLSGGESVVQVKNTPPKYQVTLVNLTITSGSGYIGAGVLAEDAQLAIQGCRIIANTASGPDLCQGGGIAAFSSTLEVEDTLIGGNIVRSTGGPCGPCNCNGQVRSNGYGGGIFLESSTAAFRDCQITGNAVIGIASGCNSSVKAFGGGIYKAGSGLLTLHGCRLTTNTIESQSSASCNQPCCDADGAAAVIAAPAVITACRFENNSFVGCGGNVGGPIFSGASIEISSTRLCGNTPGNYQGSFLDLGSNVLSDNCPACTGDLNGDGLVNSVDLGILLGAWGVCP